jgi:mannose-1-phosphate guanylyltransferase/mannose-6-phosphate isomerase
MILVPVILAGGGGTRLWPLSREHYPKQFLSLAGKGSLLQRAFLRLDGLTERNYHAEPAFTVQDPLVICNEEHRFLVAEQARQVDKPIRRAVLEPAGRNTAPALTCAALLSAEDGEDPILLMMPADHIIEEVTEFHGAIVGGFRLADQGYLITFGIVPDRPETGYGYIKRGLMIGSGASPGLAVHHIETFVEKPDLATAVSYIDSGHYAWNSGIFMMKASVWLRAIRTYRPDILAACEQACSQGSSDNYFYRLDKSAFLACPSESVDYAVMERITYDRSGLHAAVVSLDAGWSDVGSWSSLWQISKRDQNGNVVQGDICTIDAHDNVLFSEHRLLAVLGCDNLVVIETPDAVLVASKDRAQDIKRIVEWLKERQRQERLNHRRVYRPWGSYEGVDAGERFQVKRIIVNPGNKLSLQMHHHRAEHWIVVKGTARVTRGNEEFLLTENQSTYIPLGVSHRLENPGTIPLELIEVQSGPYLGEDDIVRFEDTYNRHKQP